MSGLKKLADKMNGKIDELAQDYAEKKVEALEVKGPFLGSRNSYLQREKEALLTHMSIIRA